MRQWLILVVLVAGLAQAFAPFTDLWPAQGRQTKAVVPTASKAPVAEPRSAQDKALFEAANRERQARRLAALKWSAALASAARAHAQKMAQAGALSHQFQGEMDMATRIRMAGVRFRAVAENVAQGPSVAVIHKEWMDSPAHRDNVLDADLDSIGSAVVERNGQLFAVQDFSQAAQ